MLFKKKNNILILSAGRRVELVKLFQKEVKKYRNITIFASDSNPNLSASCYIVKKFFKIPFVFQKNYLSQLIRICKNNQINICIPTIDTELYILSKNRKVFEKNGIKIIVSSNDIIKKSNNKKLTKLLFEKLKIPTLPRYSSENLKFPCIAKPFNGSSSKNIYIIKNKDFLFKYILKSKNMIFEKYLDKNYSEYSADAYYNKLGLLKCLVLRKRIEVRAGEINKGLTEKNKLYQILVKKLYFIKGARGPINFQFFYNNITNKYYGIEINPRFGGGFPLTYASGANYVKWIIDENIFNDEIKFYDKWKKKLLMLRYDHSLLINAY